VIEGEELPFIFDFTTSSQVNLTDAMTLDGSTVTASYPLSKLGPLGNSFEEWVLPGTT
jgi:hypothetical protein